MEGQYDVILDLAPAGKVVLKKTGLYYHILCSCQTINGATRLIAHTDQETVDLGICVPMDMGFGLNTHISCKRLQGDSLWFQLQTEPEKDTQRFVPVHTGESFGYLSDLMDAVFTLRNREGGLLLPVKDPTQSQQDNDQSPIYRNK